MQPDVFNNDVIVKTNDKRIIRGRRIHQRREFQLIDGLSPIGH
jgi:hypothetical protein